MRPGYLRAKTLSSMNTQYNYLYIQSQRRPHKLYNIFVKKNINDNEKKRIVDILEHGYKNYK